MSSLSQRAYHLIREKVVTLELPPSSVIDEAALMEELELGRTPIREALQRLAAENLVVILPRRGMFVADISLPDLQQIFEVRIVLEGHCARLAAERVTDEEIALMEELFEELDQLGEKDDNQRLIAVDRRFHELLAQASHNRFLADTLDRFYALSSRLWYLALDRVGQIREAIQEHRIVLEALKRRDADAAEAALQRHITSFQERIKSVM